MLGFIVCYFSVCAIIGAVLHYRDRHIMDIRVNQLARESLRKEREAPPPRYVTYTRAGAKL